MKRLFILTTTLFWLIALSPQFLYSLEAKAVINSVLEKLAPGQWKGTFKFVNYRMDGTKHRYALLIQAKDANTVHITFTSPRVEVGRQILNKNGDLWSYLPDSRSIIRMKDRDAIGNGDFNNADVMKLNWLRDYTPKIIKETSSQVIIDMVAKRSGTAYHKIRMWVLKDGMQPVQQFFYDKAGHHLKTLKYRNVKKTKYIKTKRPTLLIMENVITKQRTDLTVITFEGVQSLPKNRFRQENLGK